MKFLFWLILCSPYVTSLMSATMNSATTLPPPIVYTIAGSDSGGGAGIQADLHAIQSFECHGCSAVTCLTAQNSCGVTGVHTPLPSFLLTQLKALQSDLPPRSIKIGMLATPQLAETVGSFLKEISSISASKKPWVVVDPVMISTSGHALIDDETKSKMIKEVFPYADVLTPNKFEAEALLGRKLETPEDVEQGAREILAMGVKSVLIKGGHSLLERDSGEIETSPTHSKDINATLGFAQDFFLSSAPSHDGEPRLCDGNRGVWIRNDRYDSKHTHGTGCTLSSAIASALALGHQRSEVTEEQLKQGATRAIYPLDACCLAKAYVTAGIGRGQGLGKGPGPVAHTQGFPSTYQHFPRIALEPKTVDTLEFRPMKPHSIEKLDKSPIPTLGRILPIVDKVEWVERLCQTPGITDIQLRIKDETDSTKILQRIQLCQKKCRSTGIRLWINDYWEEAIKGGCFGVHLGQEDLAKCADRGGLKALHKANLALGISTHSYGELAAALAVKPSYISLGPIFATTSKKVLFDQQGLDILSKWRQLISPEIPLVAIGSIGDANTANQIKRAGADCAAVIGAITKADNINEAVVALNEAMS
mmetsp:Transcript_26839/g.40621  ORF Transcript_26839/g.40621 Transcript_26839/m.40621 type:complete len:592 (-) Transcript_26839:36-1811(-)